MRIIVIARGQIISGSGGRITILASHGSGGSLLSCPVWRCWVSSGGNARLGKALEPGPGKTEMRTIPASVHAARLPRKGARTAQFILSFALPAKAF